MKMKKARVNWPFAAQWLRNPSLAYTEMNINELQKKVKASHDTSFGETSLEERFLDIEREFLEVLNYKDEANLKEETGDLGYSLLQLCNEKGYNFAEVVSNTIKKLDKRPKTKVALIGTSANPITNAHITLGLEVLALTDVDEVWYYLPAKHPWDKKLINAQDRVKMLELAVAAYPKLKVCDYEVRNAEEIYKKCHETAPILKEFLIPTYPKHQFSWVMGADVAKTFHEWNGSQWMADNLDMIILNRSGYVFDKEMSILKDKRHKFLEIVSSNISSTLVRERGRLYDWDKVAALVPKAVFDYLKEYRLLDDF